MAVVAYGGVPEKRVVQGWSRPSYGGAQVQVVTVAETARMVNAFGGGAHHIFSGVGTYRGVTQAMVDVRMRRADSRFILTEAVDGRGLKGVLRELRFLRRVRKFDRHVCRYLAIGPRARVQLERANVGSSRILSFGYFVDSRDSTVVPPSRDLPHLIFVGQYIARKDPESFITALEAVRGKGWTASLYGSGPLLDTVKERVRGAGLDDRIGVHDSVANSIVRSRIRESDVLILPSRHDGWGAVVNEALMAGVPVIVSQQSGASTLVASSLQGHVFDRTERQGLRRAVETFLSSPHTSEEKAALMEWSADRISAKVAADYLVDCLREEVPSEPPWAM